MPDMDILLVLGVALVAGIAGQKIFKRFGIPQVVGGIVAGLLLGVSMEPYNLIDEKTIDALTPIVLLALAFIGFNIGGELRADVLRSLGKSVVAILLCESLFAFALVSLVSYLILRNTALGLVFGALAAATAPAATTDVIYEYRASGPLTITLLAIVGLDDVVGLVLYGFVSGYVKASLLGLPLTIANTLLGPVKTIALSLLVGSAVGLAAILPLKKATEKRDILIITLGSLLLVLGLSEMLDLSEILASMATGIVITNVLHTRRTEVVFEGILEFSQPFLVVFFVLVGARLQVRYLLIPSVVFLSLMYVGARTAGKMSGSYLGAAVSGAPESVKKYLGYALFSQAGVAIGLAFAFYREFTELGGHQGIEWGILVINVIAVTTLIVQLIGPPFVKYALVKAGEAKTVGPKKG